MVPTYISGYRQNKVWKQLFSNFAQISQMEWNIRNHLSHSYGHFSQYYMANHFPIQT